MRMADKGWTKGWGLGRHVVGSNYFHYVRDPWGSFSEYSCDIDYIPKDERWPAADHKPEELVLPLGSRRAARIHHQLRGRGGVRPRHSTRSSVIRKSGMIQVHAGGEATRKAGWHGTAPAFDGA